MVEWQVLATVLVLAGGAGVFLRLVAKETRRRENYLKLRLEQEQHEAELEANRRRLEEESRNRRKRRSGGEPDADGVPVVTGPPSAA